MSLPHTHAIPVVAASVASASTVNVTVAPLAHFTVAFSVANYCFLR